MNTPTPRRRGPTPGSLRQRALAAGLPYMTVYQRMQSHTWTLERALSTPVRPYGSRLLAAKRAAQGL